jgi:hypothetical protein
LFSCLNVNSFLFSNPSGTKLNKTYYKIALITWIQGHCLIYFSLSLIWSQLCQNIECQMVCRNPLRNYSNLWGVCYNPRWYNNKINDPSEYIIFFEIPKENADSFSQENLLILFFTGVLLLQQFKLFSNCPHFKFKGHSHSNY